MYMEHFYCGKHITYRHGETLNRHHLYHHRFLDAPTIYSLSKQAKKGKGRKEQIPKSCEKAGHIPD